MARNCRGELNSYINVLSFNVANIQAEACLQIGDIEFAPLRLVPGSGQTTAKDSVCIEQTCR